MPAPYSLLPSSHASARPDAALMAELERRLRPHLRGELGFDPGSRALYTSDASNYRHIPMGVVLPRDAADVAATLAVCRELGAPVLPRGAGTSLAGQTCNLAVVLDFSRYMNRLLGLDPQARRARVEPGIVLDRVREAAEAHGLTFAPDPATHSRCTLGGMIGNNSCGVHSVMSGKTVDNLAGLDVMLYDGTRLALGPTSGGELAAMIAAGGRRGQIYAGLQQLVEANAAHIRSGFPRVSRRVSGYNLDQLLPENGFHVARALVGSEGTCATVIEATLELVPSPPRRVLVGIGFPDVFLAADAVPQILAFRPIGLEGFDGRLLELLRARFPRSNAAGLFPPGQGFLLVEFGGWSDDEASRQASQFVRALADSPSHPGCRIYTASEAAQVWHVRESGLGLTAFPPDRPTGWEGWEDAAVAPEKLGSYLRQLQGLFDRYGYQTPFYGHFGEGCVHMRINFDFESEAGILAFRRFIEEAADLVVAHGGSISGEHGDGQARGALLPKMFGPELMRAFRDFKRLWDPDGRMNPGKLIDAAQPHADLRFGADYSPHAYATNFALPGDSGSLAHAVSRCVGVGLCRKESGGAMCPSYMVTREERFSTRGRAHLLWEMLQGEVLDVATAEAPIKQALDLCLSCKACKSECPVSVDMATYKAEFLSHYYERHPRPAAAYAFGYLDRWARLGSRFPAVANRLAPALAQLLGLHPERRLPRLTAAYTARPQPAKPVQAPAALLWPDTFNNHFHPEVLQAAAQVLRGAGFAAQLPDRPLCCGRPLYDFGMLREARAYLERLLDSLAPAIAAGIPVVVLEPSCASVFRDEMVNLLPHDRRAAALREQVYLMGEFLSKFAPAYRPPPREGKILVHGHCHQRALQGMDEEVRWLRATGAEVELLDSGCCGMAGPFGFERDKYEVSMAAGERVLLPRVRAADRATLLVSDGFSCREQIEQGTGRRALHLAEILAAPETV